MKKDKEKLLKFLHSQNLMSLATSEDEICACAVYYAVDNDLNLYFLSDPATEHCQNIAKNNNVACAIADSKQKVTDKKTGAQIKGKASKVNNLENLKWSLALWNKSNPGLESKINLKSIKDKIIKSRIYKIKPTEIKFFNEVLYGPEGIKILK